MRDVIGCGRRFRNLSSKSPGLSNQRSGRRNCLYYLGLLDTTSNVVRGVFENQEAKARSCMMKSMAVVLKLNPKEIEHAT